MNNIQTPMDLVGFIAGNPEAPLVAKMLGLLMAENAGFPESMKSAVFGLWDNGEQPKTKGNKSARYKLSADIIQNGSFPSIQIATWSRNIALQDLDTTARLIASQLERGSITQEYFDELSELIDRASGNDVLIGQLVKLHPGKVFLDRQYVVVGLAGGKPVEFSLNNCGEKIRVSGEWSDQYANNTPLKSPLVAQLRWRGSKATV